MARVHHQSISSETINFHQILKINWIVYEKKKLTIFLWIFQFILGRILAHDCLKFRRLCGIFASFNKQQMNGIFCFFLNWMEHPSPPYPSPLLPSDGVIMNFPSNFCSSAQVKIFWGKWLKYFESFLEPNRVSFEDFY